MLFRKSAIALFPLLILSAKLPQAERAAIAELRTTANALLQVAEIHQRNHETTQRNFELMQQNFEISQRKIEDMIVEIRGLRTESQRILEHLFGQQENTE